MDANGTRYHLLLGRDDWGRCAEGGLRLADAWDADSETIGAVWNASLNELTLQPRLPRFAASPYDRPVTIDDRRGAGRDAFGNWYWIAPSRRELLVQSSGSGATTHFWSPADERKVHEPAYGDFMPLEAPTMPDVLIMSGLAVTTRHFLVVGVLDPAGLLIFDLHGGGSPQQVTFPSTVPFAPFDMSPAPDGGVWILDRDNRRLWALDRNLHVCTREQIINPIEDLGEDSFQPLDGGETRLAGFRSFPEGITLDAGSPIDLVAPVAVEALPDGTVLIMDSDPASRYSLIYRYRFSLRLGNPVSTEAVEAIIEEDQRAGFRLLGHDFAFVLEHTDQDGERVPDRIYVVGGDGNQAYAFDLALDDAGSLLIDPVAAFYPMRLFGGKALVAANYEVYYDFADRWIPLVEQKRPRYISEAVIDSPVFDGREPDCVWHRLMLDACIPPDTGVAIATRAANSLAELEASAYIDEPSLYRRATGSELPFVAQGGSVWYGTWETLFQRARGRYVQIRFTLTSSEQRTPSLRALRAYYPRFSYLKQYLPAVYREDALSASFLDRFLANFEGIFTAIEDRIAAFQMFFDTRSVPADALDWLASWFGAALDPAWDTNRQRLFIRHAMLFFRRRGTVPGLLMTLRLALDECADESIFLNPAGQSRIRIVEQYRTRRLPPVVLGDPTTPDALPSTQVSERWHPEQGAQELHNRYTAFLQDLELLPQNQTVEFPLTAHADAQLEEARQKYALETLGFVPSANASTQPLWSDFLRRRYDNDLAAFNTAYRLTGSETATAFENVKLPQAVPPDGAPLYDWYAFESVRLPMERTAHRFTVLLPLPRTTFVDTAEMQRRMEITRQMIDLEKPTHTVMDVKFYWAMFRLGEVRLGYDTVIDQGSRSPLLMSPAVLGQVHLLESYLAPGHPQNVTDRQVLGRDRG